MVQMMAFLFPGSPDTYTTVTLLIGVSFRCGSLVICSGRDLGPTLPVLWSTQVKVKQFFFLMLCSNFSCCGHSLNLGNKSCGVLEFVQCRCNSSVMWHCVLPRKWIWHHRHASTIKPWNQHNILGKKLFWVVCDNSLKEDGKVHEEGNDCLAGEMQNGALSYL